MLKDQLEEEMEGKSELQRQISRLNGEVTHWRTRYENEAGQRTEELEESRRKLSGRLQEAEEALEVTQAKCSNLERVKQRLLGEVEDICLDLEKAGAEAAVLDKKQRALDKHLADWRQKYEDIQRELEASQQECRHYAADLFKIKTAFEETHEQLTLMKRENRALQDEAGDLSEQLQDVTSSAHELQKSRKKAEMEKEEMQAAYEEAEAALEVTQPGGSVNSSTSQSHQYCPGETACVLQQITAYK
ncbi:putative uncharacterized protein MYH16 [Bufo gargarizans]|uniref:putative uncharacterized protein MYH16 n=1 Tax=Bufo gargarizans TaxID=30331 RepID=UPI001CF43423|nr:putative uncharacterized protein MYH16 [Bufo gargarizans]